MTKWLKLLPQNDQFNRHFNAFQSYIFGKYLLPVSPASLRSVYIKNSIFNIIFADSFAANTTQNEGMAHSSHSRKDGLPGQNVAIAVPECAGIVGIQRFYTCSQSFRGGIRTDVAGVIDHVSLYETRMQNGDGNTFGT